MQVMTIYHNPRCSKSRQTLQLLKDHGITPMVIEYLKNPPTPVEIKQLLTLLGLSPRDLMRHNEAIYQEKNLADDNLSDNELVNALSEHPTLIERPIVVAGTRAVLGRPPENVLEIL